MEYKLLHLQLLAKLIQTYGRWFDLGTVRYSSSGMRTHRNWLIGTDTFSFNINSVISRFRQDFWRISRFLSAAFWTLFCLYSIFTTCGNATTKTRCLRLLMLRRCIKRWRQNSTSVPVLPRSSSTATTILSPATRWTASCVVWSCIGLKFRAFIYDSNNNSKL